MGEVMTFRARPRATGRLGWFVAGVVALLVLTGCADDSAPAPGTTPEAVCSVAQDYVADLPLGGMTTTQTATPEEVQSSLEAVLAAYSAMAEVATEEFTVTLDQVQQGITALDAELARAGYDWSQVDKARMFAVFTPEFDSALHAMATYLQETCQIHVAMPTI